MPQTIGTREEWQAARNELAALEAEHAKLTDKVTEQRRQLPWVAVEKEYVFDTEDGKKTLAELFDGGAEPARGQNNFWPRFSAGAPSCSRTTSCSGPITRSAPAPGARISAMSSTPRACISTIATS